MHNATIRVLAEIGHVVAELFYGFSVWVSRLLQRVIQDHDPNMHLYVVGLRRIQKAERRWKRYITDDNKVQYKKSNGLTFDL